MAKLALTTLHAKRAALLIAVNQDYSVGLAKYFRDYFTAHGGEIVDEKSYTSGDKEFRPQLTNIRAANPDVIFIPGYYTEGGLIAHQARSLGIKSILLSGDGWDSPRTLELGGSAMDGAYFSTHFSPDSKAPEVQKFVAAYRAKYGEAPDTTAALGFDACGVLIDAIRRAGTTSEPTLRDTLAHTKDYRGATGSITFDEHRNVIKPAVVLQIKDKAFHYVETVSH
jgi:branched-chain amino acid transport system substrate-binding protein